MKPVLFQRRWLFLFSFCVAVILASCGAAAPTVTKARTATPVPGRQGLSAAVCQSRQLLLTEDSSIGLFGHIATLFSFANHSRETCTLFGYPALQQQDARHKPLAEPIMQSASAYSYNTPGPQVVILHPGEKAYFKIEWTDACAAPPAAFLLVTPPGNQTGFLIKAKGGSAASGASLLLGTAPTKPASLFLSRLVPACQDVVSVSPIENRVPGPIGS